MLTDPVCKMDIDERTAGHSIIFEKESYFFCSEGCQAEFLRHPEDYVKRDSPRSDPISKVSRNV